MTTEPKWKKELKQILAISSTFFVMFVLFMLLKKSMLAEYNVEFHAFGIALVGALIIAKVVLLVDLLPVTKRMDNHSNIYSVLYRSLIYLVGFTIFTLLEHFVKGLIKGDDFSQAWVHSFHHVTSVKFIINLVTIFIAFLIFNAFWVIRNHYGPKSLYKLFFKNDKEL